MCVCLEGSLLFHINIEPSTKVTRRLKIFVSFADMYICIALPKVDYSDLTCISISL